MKTSQDFITVEDTGRGIVPAGDCGAERLSSADAVDAALALLRSVGPTAFAEAALWGFRESADFTGKVEELSRFVEHLQVVGAGAVDRTRKQAAAAAAKASTSWTTGWRDDSSSAMTPATTAAVGPATGAAAITAVVDDGYRNTTEFLRGRVRISAAEARRRLALPEELLPRQGFTGEALPAVRGELGAAVASGEVGSRSATLITLALDRVRHTCAPEAADRMEYALTRVAVENDPDFLARVARKWVDALDQDGTEPSEELLRQLQGAFIRKPRHGLHHLEIFATPEQFEHLATVMNTGTNPRTRAAEPAESLAPTRTTGAPEASEASASWPAADGNAGPGVPLDLRTGAQKRLDGLVGGCKAALASGGLPATGGLRPQVMVTIDYQDLLARLESLNTEAGSAPHWADDQGAGRSPFSPGHAGNTGTMLFTGPVTASTVRKIACDADIIPVLLGGNSRILDIGRTSRIFPPHIRKALTARDLGCAFPACTIPATWCEAHHITYWSRGGTTGTDNGVMLCSRHHHLIHKEQWTIQLHTGIPWFIPHPTSTPTKNPAATTTSTPKTSTPQPDTSRWSLS